MSSNPQVKTQRRSLLAALAASIGALSLSGAAFARSRVEGEAARTSDDAGRAQIPEPGTIDLKLIGPEGRVASIRHSQGAYRVTNDAGETRLFSEFDLRFKTDSGSRGPNANAPVLLSAGTRGDRATIVFASADEIARFVRRAAATDAPSN